jgi:hypothetical protein
MAQEDAPRVIVRFLPRPRHGALPRPRTHHNKLRTARGRAALEGHACPARARMCSSCSGASRVVGGVVDSLTHHTACCCALGRLSCRLSRAPGVARWTRLRQPRLIANHAPTLEGYRPRSVRVASCLCCSGPAIDRARYLPTLQSPPFFSVSSLARYQRTGPQKRTANALTRLQTVLDGND